MSADISKAIAEMHEAATTYVALHAVLIARLADLTKRTANAISPYDMGLQLLAEFGDEDGVKTWVMQQHDVLSHALSSWYAVACIAADEREKLK